MKVRVEVTEHHIKQGAEQRWFLPSKYCPINRAIQSLGFQGARTSRGHVHIGEYEFPLPPRAHTFIKRFDAYLDVKPFSFWFTLPFEVWKERR